MSSNRKSPWERQRLSFGQWLADRLAQWAGSWAFIVGFFVFLVIWIAINIELLFFQKWDPYPFILLNLLLSCLAAIQAPVILMSQNRAAERDRHQAKKDYYIDRKAEKEIKILQAQVLELKQLLSNQSIAKESEKIETEIKAIQRELEGMRKTLQIE